MAKTRANEGTEGKGTPTAIMDSDTANVTRSQWEAVVKVICEILTFAQLKELHEEGGFGQPSLGKQTAKANQTGDAGRFVNVPRKE